MIDLRAWVRDQTTGAVSVLEFGAGLFEYSTAVCPGVPWNGGIEICEAHFDAPAKTPPNYNAILGDMRHFEMLLPDGFEPDVAMFIDSLEHLEAADAISVVGRVQQWFQKILLFVPTGEHPQLSDPWGFENPWQEHRSTWEPGDLGRLGFAVEHYPNWHGPGVGAALAIWRR